MMRAFTVSVIELAMRIAAQSDTQRRPVRSSDDMYEAKIARSPNSTESVR
jgi:hypothetical protein